jgi:integrase
MATKEERMATSGIRRRHSAGCASREGRRCTCRGGWEASVWSPRDRRAIRKTFPSQAAAKSWRVDSLAAVQRGSLRAAPPTTVQESADALLAGMRSGLVRNRSGDVYKPSVIRGYEQALRDRILPLLAGAKLADVRRRDVQALADEMLAAGASPSTIRNAVMPLRVIFRRAVEDGDVAVNPCASVRLPAVRGKRERIVAPDAAAALLALLPDGDRGLWATAFYAGLRRGELMALRWQDVDLAAGVIRVDRSYDPKERVYVEPKSRAGRRKVPIVALLRDPLLEHKLSSGRQDGLVFGHDGARPFDDSSLAARAGTAWRKAEANPITLQEARHTCASLMIAAGVNAKAICTYMGHSSITVTYDLYGHLMPGNEDQAAALLDAYLERANTQARLAQLDVSDPELLDDARGSPASRAGRDSAEDQRRAGEQGPRRRQHPSDRCFHGGTYRRVDRDPREAGLGETGGQRRLGAGHGELDALLTQRADEVLERGEAGGIDVRHGLGVEHDRAGRRGRAPDRFEHPAPEIAGVGKEEPVIEAVDHDARCHPGGAVNRDVAVASELLHPAEDGIVGPRAAADDVDDREPDGEHECLEHPDSDDARGSHGGNRYLHAVGRPERTPRSRVDEPDRSGDDHRAQHGLRQVRDRVGQEEQDHEDRAGRY